SPATSTVATPLHPGCTPTTLNAATAHSAASRPTAECHQPDGRVHLDPDDDLHDVGVAVAAHGGVEVVEPDDVAHQRGDLDPAAAHERDRGGPGVDVAEQALDAQLVALHPEQV